MRKVKLNNKGFAITGILYTVFILFLMILLSVLGGLNAKRKLLEKNIENLKESLEETCKDTSQQAIGYTTQYQGKYTIKVGNNEYETYLARDTSLTVEKLKSLKYIGYSDLSTLDFSSAVITEICTSDEI